ncbi:hypothetical protein Brsp07_00184 [Brucella sp. NBRC 14130]|uniref:Uncharacterized protein n=1 Tax=Brucella intermedia 229E TaxID=1337887 RepID=U4V1F4_9HYPH|nr:hypothetical protein O206_13880 [Ochrobactrum sp. EGD-AQ16]ERL99814.1 hypothetical protein Q644_08880 [Brucella intermedia 229E]SUA87898.1 Protein of uncharacterised function (DUF2699) [Brucella intermedia]
MLDQSRFWLPDCNSLLQSTDSQILFHPIARFPADDATRIEIDNDCQVQPAFYRPYVTDIDTPFLIRSVTSEVLIQKIGSDRLAMIAVRRALETRLLSGFQTILTHQSRCAGTTCPNALFVQLNMHARAAVRFA